MNKKLSGIIGIILSVILLVYFETYAYRLLSLIHFNINNYSNVVRMIIDIVIKLVMCFIIFILYKKDFKHSKRDSNIFKSILIMIISLIGLVFVMYLFNYVINYLGDIFKVKIIHNSFYNIFDKRLDIYLVIKIIKDYIIIPFLYCSIIFLSIDKLTRRDDTFTLLSGLLASICYALTLRGTVIYIIINSLSTFLLFSLLAILYKKNNSIWFSIILYGLYLISSGVIIKYIGW
mgnify:FL=1